MTNSTYYHTFPSGLRLVHRHTTSPVAYAGIMVGAGTRDEQPQLNGLAHYIEHCVFKGSLTKHGSHIQHRTAQQIIHHIEDVGGEINAYTTKEETVFYAATPNQYLSRTLHLLLDLVFHPTFPKEETDKELGVILDEIESYNDSPSELIYDDFEHLLFDGNTMAMPILGTRKSLNKISRSKDYALRFMEQYYKQERMVVFVQSRTPFPKVLESVERLIKDNSPIYTNAFSSDKDSLPQVRHTPSMPRLHTTSYSKHTHQMHIMIGGYAFPLGHKDQLGMYLLNQILGGGAMSSRLNMSLREQQGLVYTVESQYTPLSDTGYWNIYLATDPQHKEQCLQLVDNELNQVMTTPLTEQLFRRSLRQLHGQMAISAENSENNALSMAKQTLYYGFAPTWEDTFAQIQQLTPLDLQRIAHEVFEEKQRFMMTYE